MPLNIEKLQQFLTSKNMIPIKYYVMDGACFFIEIFYTKTSDIFLIYMPSKYEFEMKAGKDIYNMKYIDLSSKDNKADEYAGSKEEDQIILLNSSNSDLEENLSKNYKKDILLEDISKEDAIALRSVLRQLKRLKNCVQNIKYKLGISYKNYMCVIRRDDSIDTVMIVNHPRNTDKKLLVITDLEVLYEKNEKIVEDMQQVKDSIYQVLEKNQDTHLHVLDRITNSKKDIIMLPQHTSQKRIRYEQLLQKYYGLLDKIKNIEGKIMEEIKSLDFIYKGAGREIAKIHHKNKLEKDLDDVLQIKKELSRNIILLREKMENSMLSVDKVMFDNAIMLDSIIKNFAKLKDLC
jgi:hypothetical protein